MKKNAGLTIISKNYMPFAQVLSESFISHNPGADFFIFIIDEDVSRITEDGVFILCNDSVNIPNFKHRALYFDITEFNTSVKPDLIQHVLSMGYKSMVYLDPDIKVYGSFDRIFDRLEKEEFDFVLTPHITEPITDLLFPSEIDTLKTGIFNLGFIGVAPSGLGLISWWGMRLQEFGFNDTPSGLFTDQKWIDLFPALSGRVFIDRSKTLNMAYWNLHERRITEGKKTYMVGEEQLIFFHFSGLDINNAEGISRYQNRYQLSNRPDIKRLFEDYANDIKRVHKKDGLEESYRFGTLFGIYELTELTRRLYKRFLDLNPQKWASDPFSDVTESSFVAWLIKNRLTVEKLKKHDWEMDKVLHKADVLLKNEYKTQFNFIAAFFRTIRIIVGDKKYYDLLKVLSIISNTRRGTIIYDQKLKVK